ncbi:MAG TPA: hypothetical protein VMF14_08790 [Solirubrobacteraceae bacterium]|nr:hypothetical protein [Solirubrobacteraceae bacterium]
MRDTAPATTTPDSDDAPRRVVKGPSLTILCAITDKTIVHDEDAPATEQDARIVTLNDGSRFLVRRSRVLTVVDPEEHRSNLKFDTGHDSNRAWVELSWCKGSHGEIRLGGNPQQAAEEFLKSISSAISQGGGTDDVVKAAKAQKVTPFVSVDIGEAKNWEVTGEIDASISSQGFQGGTGTVKIHKGNVHVDVNVSVDPKGRPSGGVSVGFDDGPKEHKCPVPDKAYIEQRTAYEWIPWIPEHTESGTTIEHTETQGVQSVYFPYMKSDVIPDETAEQQFRGILQQGAVVTAVAGYTSPEGSRHKVSGFEGNDRLSSERADAALNWVQVAIAKAGAGSIEPHVSDEGRSELYSGPDNPDGTEQSGKALEETAIAAFLGSDAEAKRRTQAVLDDMGKAKSTHARAEVVYQQLRRAEITYTIAKDTSVPWTKTTPGHFDDHPAVCAPVDDGQTNKVFPQVLT